MCIGSLWLYLPQKQEFSLENREKLLQNKIPTPLQNVAESTSGSNLISSAPFCSELIKAQCRMLCDLIFLEEQQQIPANVSSFRSTGTL